MKDLKTLVIAQSYTAYGYVSTLTTAMSLVFLLSTATVAQSALVANGCQKIRANEVSAYTGPSTVGGTVTQGGILNGTSEAVPVSSFFPTAQANTFSFNISKTFITNKGVLRTLSPHLLDTVSGIGTAFAYINPATSTGIFAGATGVLFVNFTQDLNAGTANAEITGEICLVN